MAKQCVECGKSGCEPGRRRCKECHGARRRLQVKARGYYMYNLVCLACKKNFAAWRLGSKLCPDCYAESRKTPGVTNQYVYVCAASRCDNENMHEHRRLAESVIGRRLTCDEVVHHVDENPKNNVLVNLLILSRKNHGRLHGYLSAQRVILAKADNENFVNCWDTLIAPMTTAWLETTNAKVIKLWEIGQSAAKPLNGEGSETRDEASVTSNVVDDDIVQTTTDNMSGLGDQK